MRELEEENSRLKAALNNRESFIRDTVRRYLSDEVLEEILQNDDNIQIGGERKVVTILFSSPRNFSISAV